MRRVLFVMLVLMAGIIAGCCDTPQQVKDTGQLLEVDRQFSQMSDEKGAKEAFAFYMADSAMVLRDGSWPISDKEGILAPFENMAATGAKLLWEPEFADIAASNDLGYTVGTWTYTVPDSTGAIQTAKGNYVTIWKKMADGSWKYVFDTGTNGPEEE